jgi:hypothetical protein
LIKRLFLTIAISTALVAVYMIVVSVIYIAAGQNTALVPYLDVPVRLPKIVYFYFYPPTAADYQINSARQIILGLTFLVINIFLYSIPVYFVLRLIGKRRTVNLKRIDMPPAPPLFSDRE